MNLVKRKSPRAVPLGAWLRRRRLNARLAAVFGVLVLAVLLVFRGGYSGWDIDERKAVKLAGVGDSFLLKVVEAGGQSPEVAVRLIGVAMEPTLMEQSRQWLENENENENENRDRGMWVSFDEGSRRDPDGTIRAYLYLPDGRMVNESLLADGRAKARDEPHVLHDWFVKLENIARRRKRGVFGE